MAASSGTWVSRLTIPIDRFLNVRTSAVQKELTTLYG